VRLDQTRQDVSFAVRGPFGKHGRLQWYTADKVPSLVAKAAQENGYSSSAHYIRTAIIRALERDLGIDFASLDSEQPSKASNSIYADPTRYSASGSSELVF
jgi:hypothetical protein